MVHNDECGDRFEASVQETFEKKIIRRNEEFSVDGLKGEIDFETEEAIVEVGWSLKGKNPQLHKLAEIAIRRGKRLDVVYGPKTPRKRVRVLKDSLRKKHGNRIRFIPHEQKD